MIVYGCCIALQCGYVFFFFIRFFFIRPVVTVPRSAAMPPVSVIICARNEAMQLSRNLPAVLEQRYVNGAGKPNYEVVVVNDGSVDDTGDVLAGMTGRYPHLRVVNIAEGTERDLPGKKFALRAGVRRALNSWILMTDADCCPVTPEWIPRMVSPLAAGKEIVTGYAPYLSGSSFLNAFIRWETMHTMLQYSGYALAGIPYMAVGRNFACTRDVLDKAMQHPLWSVVPSGDDDLLMRIAANKGNTAIVAGPETYMYSPAKYTWREWLKQKQRHMSTGKYYKPAVQLLLGGYALSHTATWLLFGILIFSGYVWIAAGMMIFRCLLYWLLWLRVSQKLRERRLAVFFPFFDFGWMIYNFVLAPYILWKNKRQWT